MGELLRDYAARWIAAREAGGLVSATADARTLRRYLLEALGDRSVVAVTREDLVSWLGEPDRTLGWRFRGGAVAYVIGAARQGWGWGVDARWDDEVLATATGTHTGDRYEVVRHRSAWADHLIDCITWVVTRAGRRMGPGLSSTATQLATVAEALARIELADRAAAASGDRSPLSRTAFEAEIARLGGKAVEDRICMSLAISGSWDTHTPEGTVMVVTQALAVRRAAAIGIEEEAARSALPPPVEVVYRWGARGVRYDERCPRCRRVTEVDNETDLCRHCGGR